MNISPDLERQLHQLLEVFLAENEKINLSALRTEEAAWNGHVLDALAMIDAFPKMPEGPILDVGTGGGFPLLPLAMALPEHSLVGLDSTAKKIKAIERIAAGAGVTNVSLVTGRCEELGQDSKHREKYDIVTSRAVAALPTLIEYCSPFARVQGFVVLWKSMHIEEELAASERALKECRLKLEKSFAYTLPEPLGERQLLIYRKVAPLPRMYPRAVGVPGKEPL